ncbi:nutritionally-regulated adipose and cardiac enriched protein homolog isoform X2 [Phyllostomus hastatus]|uniref:nutritionally-regulated adipose and cardiac enriched protein homolog isoform X2 n=1 Tax=Phyllostomus hastatus TaxID=9423 RepID=UPI001E67FB06|nr:nutritionally-regulated adipose and cardiac enriched protein homolog isoform X2 [Phyllostomus hastatus]
MRTAPRARSPDPRPETRRQSRRNVAAAPGSPTPRAGREGDRKRPPSILRQSQPERPGRGAEPPRIPKRVRFHEPVEVAVHYIAGREPTPATQAPRRQRPHARSLLLGLSLGLLLALLLGLCCGRPGPLAPALEDLRARLRALALRLRHLVVACWHCLRPL